MGLVDNKLKIYVIGLLIILGGTRGCNMLWNNRDVKTPNRHTISNATWLIGHNEFTKYKDGSVDLKVYPGILSHRIISSKLYQDLNGDGLVDRIRNNGPAWQFNRLRYILDREVDYDTHKENFDKADELLAKGKRDYQRKYGQ
ncbi:MAG: hypothetical protein ISS82_03820 [Nanoarchaeota archaeon]|nr:hypothetical protein [Nanoarchaeota archaeon]